MGLLRDKVGQAMDLPTGATPWSTSAAIAGWQPLAAPEPQPAGRPALSATLASTFGLGNDAPALVRAAYGKFKAFGL